MFYAISTDIASHRLQLTIFESRRERDAWVRRHWKSGAFAVTARQARNWVKNVRYIDTNGTDTPWYLDEVRYPSWLENAIRSADHAFGTWDTTTYVLA